MELHPVNKPLLKAFLARESQDFKWECGANRQAYLKRIYKQILVGLKQYKKADFICIQSLTNLGQVERELKLTPANGSWVPGKLLLVILPPNPNPRYKVGIQLVE